MTHGGGGDRPRRRDINDESSKLGNDDRSEVVDLVEVVRSSCGEREELVERGKSSQRVAEQRKDEALFRTRTGDPLLTIAPKRLPWIASRLRIAPFEPFSGLRHLRLVATGCARLAP
jgi:hypothetical protein